MVDRSGTRAGKAHVGCLLTLAVLAIAIYFGVGVAEVYWRYYRLQDFVKSQVEFAPVLTDDVILRRLVGFSDTLGVGLGDHDWNIRRSWSPREITISARYADSIVIAGPGFRRVFRVEFRPYAKAPL
jgi:hypothetical protein